MSEYAVICSEYRDPLCVSLICKNGTQTIIDYMVGSRILPHEALKYDIRIGILRHPRLRIDCNWSFYRYLRDNDIENYDVPPEVLDKYEDFIDYILEVGDDHWNPQVEQLMVGGQYSPTHSIRFEDLANWWPQIFDKPIKHNNFSPSSKPGEHRTKELERRYAQDYKYWNAAIGYEPGLNLYAL